MRRSRRGLFAEWFGVKGTSKVRRRKRHCRDGSGTGESDFPSNAECRRPNAERMTNSQTQAMVIFGPEAGLVRRRILGRRCKERAAGAPCEMCRPPVAASGVAALCIHGS